MNFLTRSTTHYTSRRLEQVIFLPLFSILTVLIACLGMVGLAAYMVEQKTREIGKRKEQGATATQIMTLFSKDFLLLIVIGFLLTVPITWFVMSEWLRNFAYRNEIQWSIFLAAGLITILFALLTVGYQTLKAARLDPVESLRIE